MYIYICSLLFTFSSLSRHLQVHPLEEQIKADHQPVRQLNCPNLSMFQKFKLSKKGKKTKKLLFKYVRKNCLAEVRDKLPQIMVNNIFNKDDNWKYISLIKAGEYETTISELTAGEDFSDAKSLKKSMNLMWETNLKCLHDLFMKDIIPYDTPDLFLMLDLYLLMGGDLARHSSNNGHALIHNCAMCGYLVSLQWLLEKGVDVNSHTGINQFGTSTYSTPLMISCFHQQAKSCEILCKTIGLDIERRNLSGNTALHILAAQRNKAAQKSKKARQLVQRNLYTMFDLLKDVAHADVHCKVAKNFEKNIKNKNKKNKEKDSLQFHCDRVGNTISDLINNNAALCCCVHWKVAPSKRGSEVENYMKEMGFPTTKFGFDYIQMYVTTGKLFVVWNIKANGGWEKERDNYVKAAIYEHDEIWSKLK